MAGSRVCNNTGSPKWPHPTDCQGQNAEEGMQCVDELVGGYSHSCLWWFGPWFPILRLFHPEAVKPVLLESVAIAPKDYLFYGFLKPWLGECPFFWAWICCAWCHGARTPGEGLVGNGGCDVPLWCYLDR
ncbi:unnamed protein product [Caretta caretta]